MTDNLTSKIFWKKCRTVRQQNDLKQIACHLNLNKISTSGIRMNE